MKPRLADRRLCVGARRRRRAPGRCRRRRPRGRRATSARARTSGRAAQNSSSETPLPAAAAGLVLVARPGLAAQRRAVFAVAVEVDLDPAQSQLLVAEPGAGADAVQRARSPPSAPASRSGWGIGDDADRQLAAAVGLDVGGQLRRDDRRVDHGDDAERVQHRLDQPQRRRAARSRVGSGRRSSAAARRRAPPGPLQRAAPRRRPARRAGCSSFSPAHCMCRWESIRPGTIAAPPGSWTGAPGGSAAAASAAVADGDDPLAGDRDRLGARPLPGPS